MRIKSDIRSKKRNHRIYKHEIRKSLFLMLNNRLFESSFAIVIYQLETNHFGFVNRRNFRRF